MAKQGVYEVGDIIRYADGPVSIMRVSAVIPFPSKEDVQYYGQHVLGGVHKAWHSQCRRASAKDREIWYDEGRKTTTRGAPLRAPWKQFLEKYGTNVLGKQRRMEDAT